jgi:hypothetical protein
MQFVMQFRIDLDPQMFVRLLSHNLPR